MQGFPNVTVSGDSPNQGVTSLIDYQSGSAPVYLGFARSRRFGEPPNNLGREGNQILISSISAASVAVVTTSSNHGLQTGNSITIYDGTGSWVGLNGVQIITVLSPTTFSVPVNSSAYSGTSNNTLYTTAAQTSKPVWAIQKLIYSGSSVIARLWANGDPSDNQIWDNRTSLAYN